VAAYSIPGFPRATIHLIIPTPCNHALYHKNPTIYWIFPRAIPALIQILVDIPCHSIDNTFKQYAKGKIFGNGQKKEDPCG
jgi:hypothetical protein